MKKIYLLLIALIGIMLLIKVSMNIVKDLKHNQSPRVSYHDVSTGVGLTIYYKIDYPVALNVPGSSRDGFAIEILNAVYPDAKFVPILDKTRSLTDILRKEPYSAIIAPITLDEKNSFPTGKFSLGDMSFALYRLRDPKALQSSKNDIIAYPTEFCASKVLEELAKKSKIVAVESPHYLAVVQQKMRDGEISAFIAHHENFLWSIENTNINLLEFFKIERVLEKKVPVKIFFSPLDQKFASEHINWSDKGIKRIQELKSNSL